LSNYTQSTNFATKDALTSGDPLKIVKGTEINTEFVNISVAIATKADLASPTFTGTPTLPTGTIATTQTFGNSSTLLATTAFVQAALATLHPVGSIYINATVSTNPGTLLGFGTWTAFGAGRVMVGFDSGNALFDTAEETGGVADATLPSHTHTGTTDAGGSSTGSVTGGVATDFGPFSSATGVLALSDSVGNRPQGAAGTGSSRTATLTIPTHQHTFTTASAGTSGTNANYQPYITVYMWKRTA
jgi:hypothetical protein